MEMEEDRGGWRNVLTLYFSALYSRCPRTARLSPVGGNRGKYGSTETYGGRLAGRELATIPAPDPCRKATVVRGARVPLAAYLPDRSMIAPGRCGGCCDAMRRPDSGAVQRAHAPLRPDIMCTRRFSAQLLAKETVQSIDSSGDRAYSTDRVPLDEMRRGVPGPTAAAVARPRQQVRPAPLPGAMPRETGGRTRRSDRPAARSHDRGRANIVVGAGYGVRHTASSVCSQRFAAQNVRPGRKGCR